MANRTVPGGITLSAVGAVASLVFDPSIGPPSEAIFSIGGSFVGASISFLGSLDGGVTYTVPLCGYRTDVTGQVADTGVIPVTDKTNRAWRVQCEGLTAVQLQLSLLTSGNMVVTILAGAFFGTPPAQGGSSGYLSAILYEAIKLRQVVTQGLNANPDYTAPQLDVTAGL